MKKLTVLVLTTLLLSVGLAYAADAAKPFDKAAVDAIMHNNVAGYGALNKAVEAKDFDAVAAAFYELAKNNKTLLGYNPPKGDKAVWDKILTDLIYTAYRGVGAAGEKDIDKVKKVLGEIKALNGQGHGTFR